MASDWITISGHEVIGKPAVPPEPKDFRVQRLASGRRSFSWRFVDPPADLRASGGVLLRFATAGVTSWEELAPLHVDDRG